MINMLRQLSPLLKSALRHLIISFIILSPVMFSAYLIFDLIALACTTCYLDLPDVLCLVLFGSLYWLFLYLSLYIYIRWGVFQTCIKTTWHKACTHQSYLVFFLNILNIIFCYALIYLSYLVLKGDKETFVKILLIMSECSSIYFCFLSKTGWELVITTLSYLILNLIIGGFIAYKGSVFLRSSILYLIVNVFIFFNIYCASIKKAESLTSISNQIKVRVVLSKLVFLLVILSYIKVNSTYSWIWPWLATFMLKIGVLNHFFFFFEKKDEEFFQTLGRKETTFLSRLIIYGSAVPFFFMFAWGG